MSSKGFVVGAVIGLIALCACALALGAVAAAIIAYRAGGMATATPIGMPDPTQTAAEMDSIQAYVIVARGLQPEAPVERKFLTTEEVLQRTIDDFEKDTSPEEVQDDVRVLAALGLIEPGVDLYQLLIRLYSEGIAGFYDPETSELVVVSELQGLNAYEQTVFAHEYTHALQDQIFDIEASGFRDEVVETDPERFVAIQAVLEGDASLLEEQYRDTLSPAERRENAAALDSIDVSIYLELPDFLLQDFVFPYEQGLNFVRRYYDEGGWARVDEVWRNPPVSTEHILHPERYEAGDWPSPLARPPLTSTLGAGWRQIESNMIGEWYTYLILAHGADSATRLADRTAYRAAEGWGGDGLTVFHHDEAGQTVLAARWEWDTQADADEFAEAFREYGDLRFGAAEAGTHHVCWTAEALACFYFDGRQTLWILAPDAGLVEAVLQQYPDFSP